MISQFAINSAASVQQFANWNYLYGYFNTRWYVLWGL